MLLAAGFLSRSTFTGSSEVPLSASDGVRVLPAVVAELREKAKDFQLALVESDGVLSWEDYDRLYHELVRCVQEAGGEILESRLTAARVYDFALVTPPGVAETACGDQFWEPLGPLWSLHNPFPVETYLSANTALGQCIRDSGIPFDIEHPRASDFEDLGSTYGPGWWIQEPFASCQAKVTETFGLNRGFLGY